MSKCAVHRAAHFQSLALWFRSAIWRLPPVFSQALETVLVFIATWGRSRGLFTKRINAALGLIGLPGRWRSLCSLERRFCLRFLPTFHQPVIRSIEMYLTQGLGMPSACGFDLKLEHLPFLQLFGNHHLALLSITPERPQGF